MRIVQVTNMVNALKRLKLDGIWIVGAEASGGETYFEVDFTSPTLIVLGAEGKGISRLVKENCDFLVRIPMLGKVSSLNVATAGAVLFHEAARQREGSGS